MNPEGVTLWFGRKISEVKPLYLDPMETETPQAIRQLAEAEELQLSRWKIGRIQRGFLAIVALKLLF